VRKYVRPIVLIVTIMATLIAILALAGSAGAQDSTIRHGQAMATIRGSLVAIANNDTLYLVDSRTQQWFHKVGYGRQILDLNFNEGYLAVTLDSDIVLVEHIGTEGENLGSAKTAGKVPGKFSRATLAGDMLIGSDNQGKLLFMNWRSGEAAAPEPPPVGVAFLPYASRFSWLKEGAPRPAPTARQTPEGPPYPPAPTDPPTVGPPPLGPTVMPRP
jgi:hypothetical protein